MISWMKRRSFGDNDLWSPIKAIKDKMPMGSQNEAGIPKYMEDERKTTKIPIPPPFGVGSLCELRLRGQSMSPILLAYLPTTQAPAAPNIKLAAEIDTMSIAPKISNGLAFIFLAGIMS